MKTQDRRTLAERAVIDEDGVAHVDYFGYDVMLSVEDLEREDIGGYAWSFTFTQKGAPSYLMRCIREKENRSGKSTITLHRAILNADDGDICDHIDRNRLNNTRSNLRMVNARQNVLNCTVRTDNKTGVRGVQAKTLKDGRKIYQASVYPRKGERVRMRFTSLKAAAKWRLQMEKRYYGVYAPT